MDRESCNAHACAKPKKGMICNGRLLLPCDLLAKLNFGSNNYLNPKLKQSGFARCKLLFLCFSRGEYVETINVLQPARFRYHVSRNVNQFSLTSEFKKYICERRSIFSRLEVHPPTERFLSSSTRRVKRQTANRFCEK